jgi:hypothetical protein
MPGADPREAAGGALLLRRSAPTGLDGTGKPLHGPKLDTKDPNTWPTPSAEHRCEDPAYGVVRVRAWAGLHSKIQDHLTRGTRRPRPIVRGTLVLVEVSHLPRGERPRKPKELWLWWHGPGEPELELLSGGGT